MPEKSAENFFSRSMVVILILLAAALIGVVIAIPIIYSTGRDPGSSVDQSVANISQGYVTNECTQSMSSVKAVTYLEDQEPFPYKLHTFIYRPSVIAKKISLFFGFRHDVKSWSLDNISFVDTTTNEDLIQDGGFESNYLNLFYQQCILSNTRSSVSDILFDIPYAGDFYYNDQTVVGMTYLMQQLSVNGGRYYNISFYLENRGFPNPKNYFVLLVGTVG